jgi:hypothetical protein
MNALTPGFISPLDGNYVSLKRAAILIAHERPGIAPGEIMDLFKHAIFTENSSVMSAASKGSSGPTIGTFCCCGSKPR